MQRLDQFLSAQGLGTRKEVRKDIRSGRIAVNGQVVTIPEAKIDPARDAVERDSVRVTWSEHVYRMLNKPAGVITAARDPHQRTVMDLIPPGRKGIQPVGRLDKDTTGLLLLTDDGDLAHRLLSPAHHVEKVYEVQTDLPIPPDAAARFAAGLELSDFTAKPAELAVLQPGFARVTICEGKFHQVKRMFAAVSVNVVALRRISFGPLTLDPALPEGESRVLTPEEEEALKAL